MSNTYRLVNPHIEGDFKSKMKADNSMVAARSFYKNLSQHFNNNIPKFICRPHFHSFKACQYPKILNRRKSDFKIH